MPTRTPFPLERQRLWCRPLADQPPSAAPPPTRPFICDLLTVVLKASSALSSWGLGPWVQAAGGDAPRPALLIARTVL